ncbi:hypothetical protein Tco_1509494 [Tanacetum coccineum]
MRAPPSRSGKSPGNESLASFPLQLIPGDMSPGIGFPSDKSPGKAWKCRWGLWREKAELTVAYVVTITLSLSSNT